MATINGTSGADTALNGTAGDDVINGLGGNDKIDGGAGADQIDGGAGADIIKGGDGNDVITGGLGNDTIVGGTGQDTALYLATSIAAASTGPAPIGSWNGAILTLATGSEGTDLLNQVESLNFNGQTFAVNGYNGTTPYNVVANLGADSATVDQTGITTVSGQVLANDYDVDSQLTVTGARTPPLAAPGEAIPLDPKGPQAINGFDVTGAYGTLHIATDGSYTYVASGSGYGVDHFQYSVTDGGITRWVNLNITVTHVNHAPVTSGGYSVTDEDASVSGYISSYDTDGDTLTYSLVSGPTHGSLSLNSDGSYNYTPDANYHGSDSFSFSLSDGHGGSTSGFVNLTVNPVNDAPVTYAGSGSAAEDHGISGWVSASDVDGDSLTYTVVSGPAHGSVTISSNGQYFYTPDANYHGSDSFTFKVNDGTVDSNVSTFSLNLSSENDAPAAADASASTNEDTAVTGSVHATDADGDSLTYGVASTTQHGSLSLNSDGSYTYTPNANYHGSDSFDFSVSDGHGGTDYGHVTINVGSVNDAPVAANGSGSGAEDSNITGSVQATDADSDPLTYSVVSGPAHGSLSFNSDGTYTYTPNANYHGSDSFTFRANDGAANSNTATVSLNVSSVNDAPHMPDAGYSTNEDTQASGSVAGTDADGDPLTYSLVSGPSHGTVTFHSDGTYTYTPDADYWGGDSFRVRANDGTANSNTGTVYYSVVAVNDAPTASGGSNSTNEDTSVTGQVSGADIDGNNITFAVVSGPAHGSLSFNSDGSYTYTPNANYHGSDSFTFRSNDGVLNSAPATISLNVSSVNDLPVASNGSASAPEDTVITGAAHATDVDGDSLTYSVVSGPQHGSLSFNSDGTYSYTPDANYHGSDSFTFRANDGHGNSNLGTISLDVDPPVNDNTVAYNGSGSGSEDGIISGWASASDVDGDSLTYSLVNGPAHGSLSFGSDGSYLYIPDANYHGSDSFTFKANDGTADSNTATISLNVASVNDAPAAADASASTNEDTTLSGSVQATDADSDTLTYGVASTTQHGSLSFNSDGTYTYTPNANYHGPDSFDFSVSDGHGGTDYGTVTINVASVNDVPAAADGSASGAEDSNITGTVHAIDADGDSLTYSVASGPAHGSLSLGSDGSYTYTPNANYNGSDGFDFQVSDGHGGTDTGHISINVSPVNDAPVAADASASTNEDTVLSGAAHATDADGDSLTYALASGAQHGSLSFNSDGTYTYTPNANYHGSDSFDFSVSDGHGGTDYGHVAINVASVNDAPAVTPTVSVSTFEGADPFAGWATMGHVAGGAGSTGVNWSGQAGIIYGDGVSLEQISAFADATGLDAAIPGVQTSGSGIRLDFDTTAGQAWEIRLRFSTGDTVDGDAAIFISDENGQIFSLRTLNNGNNLRLHNDSTTAGHHSLYLVVIGGGNAGAVPQLQLDGFLINGAAATIDTTHSYVKEDSVLNSHVYATDPDGDAVTYALASGGQAAHGTVVVNANGSFTYTPTGNYNGADSFTYEVNDGHGGVTTATQQITVEPVNDLPVAAGASASTNEDTVLSGAAHATDADGETLTYALVSGTAHGSLSFNSDGTYTYTPAANYHGGDSFTFRANDGHGNSNTATVSINVASVNDVPVAQIGSFSGNEDSTISGAVHATDADGDSLTYSLYGGASAPGGSSAIQAAGVQHGALDFHSDGTFTYTPDANYHGSDSFQYRAYDGAAYSAPVTVYLNVNSVNDLPVASAGGTYGIGEDATVSGQASGSDADGDSLTWSTVSSISGLTFNADGSWTFDASANATAQALNDGETGTLSFSYHAYDGTAYSNTVSVTLNITGSTELINGTALRDVLNGTAYGDNINGLAGNDDLYGLGGADTINGGDGSDKLYGGDGADTLNGGNDADTVNGEGGNDTLSGGDGNDTMDGGDGVDIVDGGNGNDVVKGGIGNDFVYGGIGDDNVQGGEGNDFVYGGAGKDSLLGGTGADTFVFTDGDLTNLAGTTDTITDFKSAQGDILDLSGIDANANIIGNQGFTFVGAFTNHAGEMTLSFNSGTNTTTLGLDTNGDGVADYLLLLTGNVNNPNGWLL
ncbi:VCBS repeat-containing protein [Caulobacter ginsengisoli]|uniref:VCBS repeat-containing protein n=1 Tax=Caulobacter ginsengisoli TaxID=400775 RepID=A0ABU0IUL6_9CAUL|nr:Ig-like domain-containing protein [Caulobacter ginsengisoli]MDQ0465710.1 VCBS repeat-containing protein [Caulobacter ginsengisoli]